MRGVRAAANGRGEIRVVADPSCRKRGLVRSILAALKERGGEESVLRLAEEVYQVLMPARTCRSVV